MNRQRESTLAVPPRPLEGRSVLVLGPGLPLVRGLAHGARDRGALVAVATTDAHRVAADDALPCFATTLSSESDADRLLDHATGLLPALDTIIYVVAAEPLVPISEVSTERWREHVAAPLRQVFWVARRTVEWFLAGAVAGRLVLAVHPSGDSTEVVSCALRSLARSFAREYGRRALACNLVLPSGAPSQRALIEHALFLASPGASFMNGEVLVVRSAAETGARGPDA